MRGDSISLVKQLGDFNFFTHRIYIIKTFSCHVIKSLTPKMEIEDVVRKGKRGFKE